MATNWRLTELFLYDRHLAAMYCNIISQTHLERDRDKKKEKFNKISFEDIFKKTTVKW